MKLIKAIVNTDHLDALRDRLFEQGAPGLTVDSVMGIGKPMSQMRYSESRGFTPKFFARSRIEIVVDDDRVDDIVGVICEVCATGKVGDGKVFVIPVDDAIRVRTKQSGHEALY